MFNFFRKKNSDNSDVKEFNIFTDIHSHILPGLDDGAKTLEDSIDLVKGLLSVGIKKAVATPHIIGDMYRNTPETINNALKILKDACVKEDLQIELSAAAEYMLDDYFMHMLQNKLPLLTVNRNFILTEMPYTAPPMDIEEIAFGLITAGYKPIMAHPERYFYYHRNFEEYARLKEIGFLLQVNLLSLTGYYGSGVAKAAKYIFENGLVDLVGTDMHHTRHLSALTKNENNALILKYLGNKTYNDFSVIEM